MGDELLTPDEVAAILRLNRATIYRMIDRGELKAVRVGNGKRGTYRIKRSAVERLLGI